MSLQSKRLSTFSSLAGPTLLFGGTFDPIHIGHLEAASLGMAASGAANVVLIPAKQSPHKAHAPIASDAERMQMILLAIEQRPGFFLSDIECREGAPAYTIETVRRIMAEAPHLPLHLLIGADQLPGLHRWREYEQLLSTVTVWVAGRNEFQATAQIAALSDLSANTKAALQQHFLPLREFISATELRAGLKISKDRLQPQLEQALAPAVLAFIREQKLYRS